jgi:hypothetical protein
MNPEIVENPMLMRTGILTLLLLMTGLVQAQEIPLWPNGAPGARGNEPVDVPSLTPYVSSTAPENGGTIIILPGGDT